MFTGAVDPKIVEEQRSKIVSCTGKAGAVCLMHSSLLHGSAPNLSQHARTLYITTYYAEDAIELNRIFGIIGRDIKCPCMLRQIGRRTMQ